jgi:hypothetical protein
VTQRRNRRERREAVAAEILSYGLRGRGVSDILWIGD